MILGKVLADYRYANRMGGRELAKTVGISNATLSRIENGKSGDAVTLARLITWLLSEQRETKRKRAHALPDEDQG